MDQTDSPHQKTRRNASQTRERILAAARRRFSHASYENVGAREIAGDAGVNAALVNRYFGGKLNLFSQAIEGAFLVDEHLPEALADIGQALARQIVDGTDEADDGEFNPLSLLLVSATSPETAAMVSLRFHQEFVHPLAQRLPGEQREARAALIASYVIGLATTKYALKSPALNAATLETVAALVGAAIQSCVDDRRQSAGPTGW